MIETKGCPGPEMLAALADGRLRGDESAHMRAHVAGCPDCLAVVSGTLDMLANDSALEDRPGVPDEPGDGAMRSVRRLVQRGAPWLAIAAAAALVFGGIAIFRSTRPGGLDQLVRAVGARRLVEPRVIGGFGYAPFPSPRRGPVPIDRSDPGSWAIYEAAARIRSEAARDGAGAGARRALGAAHLLLGDTGEAITTLEEAARAQPADAATLGDLAAAYVVRADQAGGAEDLVRAIDAARHALVIDPDCVEARFNLALALEKQVAGPATVPRVDPAVAIGAWEEYLRHDASSPWADEARARLAALRDRGAGLSLPPARDDVERAARAGDDAASEALVAGGPRVGREVLERRLLPAWAEASREHRAVAAAAALAAATTLAQAIERVSGDPLGREAVRSAAASRDPDAALAAAQIGYARAIDLFDRDEMAAAVEGFRAALAGFAQAGSPLRWSAAVYAAIGDYYEGRIAVARRQADDLGAGEALRSYPCLLARVRWMQGLTRALAGDLSGALDRYRDARRLFERTGETDGVASTTFLIAEALDLLGDREAAWGQRYAALGLASRVATDQRRSIHLDAIFAALREGRPWAALTFQAPLFESWNASDPGALCEAYETRARILDAIGQRDAGLEDLAAARRYLLDVGEGGLRRRLEAELAAGRGTMLAGEMPRDAIAPLSEAIGYFESIPATSRLPGLYLDRGRAHETLGAYPEAETNYARGADVLERILDGLLADPLRVSLLDRAWTLFDAIVGLEAGPLARPDRAFAYAERARRAELLVAGEGGSAAAAAGCDVDAVARRITGDRTLIYLVLVPDRLLRWVFHAGRSEFRPQPVSIAEVDDLVDRVRQATDRRDEALFMAAVSRLYDLLLRPVEDLLPGSGEIDIVPDRRLDDVPYAALRDDRDGSYVLERHAVVLAPTAAYVAWPDHAAPSARGAPRVLVVGSPAFDAERHPDLATLPGAEAEARRVAALYPGSILLAGRAATARRFLAHLAGADIIHFAGHAIVNDRYPLLSALVMAPGPEGDAGDLVTALDLQQAIAVPPRLVVLGACRAAGGGTERPGGSFSLARPFLAAGVPAIVGAQWAIGDRPAAEILSSFHQELRRGTSAAASLRAAQLAALRGSDPETRSPLAWGAFLLNGTASPETSITKEAS